MASLPPPCLGVTRSHPLPLLIALPSLSQRDVAAVRAAVEAVGRTASRLWPDSRTVLFGSQATGLALPGSDLDIVVLGASDELANPATGFSW